MSLLCLQLLKTSILIDLRFMILDVSNTVKHVVFVFTIVEKTWYELFGEDFIFVHKIKQMFLYFGSCSRMQFCSIMSDDILILIDVHTCTAWFVIALVRIVFLFI